MKKRILSLAAALGLLLSLLPTAALAFPTGEINALIICGENCNDDTISFLLDTDAACHTTVILDAMPTDQHAYGEGWSYDHTTRTLTLVNYKGKSIGVMGPNSNLGPSGPHFTYISPASAPTLTVRLVGENTLTGIGIQMLAVDSWNCNLTFEGPGRLTIGDDANLWCRKWTGAYDPLDGPDILGGLVKLTNGAEISVTGNTYGRYPLSIQELIIDSGCTMIAAAPSYVRVGLLPHLEVNGTLIATSDPTIASDLAYLCNRCTVGPNVSVMGGMDAASAQPLSLGPVDDDAVYGPVAQLTYLTPCPYLAFIEQGAPEVDRTAYLQRQTISVNGTAVPFETYALKDQSGRLTNYVRLRDVAAALSGTTRQFQVGWDGNVTIQTGTPYAANGSAAGVPFTGNHTYTDATALTKIDGKSAGLGGILLTDSAGAGYTYYRLRDLGAALGFTVDWSAQQGVTIVTE